MNFGNLAGKVAGNLAGQLRENIAHQSPASFIAKISEVVAPPLEDDDDYEYETDSGSGSYYEEDDEYGEDDENSEDDQCNVESNEEEEFVFENNHTEDQPKHGNTQVDVHQYDENGHHESTTEYDDQLQPKLLFKNGIDTSVDQPEALMSDQLSKEEEHENVIGLHKTHGENNVPTTMESSDDATNNNLLQNFQSYLQNIEKDIDHLQIDSSLDVANALKDITEIAASNVEVKPLHEHEVEPSQDHYEMKETYHEAKETGIPPNDDDNHNHNCSHTSAPEADTILQTTEKKADQTGPTPMEIHLQKLLQEANDRADGLEKKHKKTISDQKSASMSQNQKQVRALYLSDQKAENALKKLDEATSKIKNLEKRVDSMNNLLQKSKETIDKQENQIKELKEENDELEDHIHEIQDEQEAFEEKIQALEEEKTKLHGLQMELHLLKEARDRDRIQIQSTADSASSNVTKICAERDEERSKAHSAQQQLEAAHADLQIMRSDLERLTLSNANLQQALEAFQYERDAELELLEQQRKDADLVLQAAHDAKITAMIQENEARMREVQMAADMAVKHSMQEIQEFEQTVEVRSRLY